MIKKNPHQYHGFLYEGNIISKYNLLPSKSYISKFDAYTQNGIPVQIKCIKYGNEICLGSFINNQSLNRDFILHIGFWVNSKTNIVREDIIYIKWKKWKKYLKFKYTNKMVRDFKKNNVKSKIKYTNLWSKAQHKSHHRPIQLRFKISKSTRNNNRIQCAIRFKDYINYILKCFRIVKY